MDWLEVINVESCGECGFELDEELSSFSGEDEVVDVYSENVDESFDEENEDARVDKGQGEAVGDKSCR